MRDLKTLYGILIEKFDEMGSKFICVKIALLNECEVITDRETKTLLSDLKKRMPTEESPFYNHENFNQDAKPHDGSSWWKAGSDSTHQRKLFLKTIYDDLTGDTPTPLLGEEN